MGAPDHPTPRRDLSRSAGRRRWSTASRYDLANVPAEMLEALSGSPAGRLTLIVMQTVARDIAELRRFFARWGVLVRELLGRDSHGVERLGKVLSYVLETGELDVATLREGLRESVDRDTVEAVMTTAQVLREEGRKQGAIEMLRRLLRKKFGPLDSEVLSELERASVSKLGRWLDRAIDAESFEEVFTAAGTRRPRRRRRSS